MTQLTKIESLQRRFLALSLLITILLISTACSIPGSEEEGSIPPPEELITSTSDSEVASEPGSQSFAGTVAAPEFPEGLDWLNTEQPLTLEQLKGKIVLLDFWTYGCINCMHVIPDLKQLEAEYPEELVVIGVHSAKFENEADTENIRNIILRYNREHPVVNDKDFIVWRTWGANAWPTLALIDPAGNVVGGHSGEGVYEIFEPVIAALVQEFEDEIDRTPLTLKLEKEGLPSRVLSFPGKVLADPARGRIFISDTNHNRILVADPETGEILDVIGAGEAGLVDGGFAEAQLNQPQGMALSEDGATLYVADTENHAIRRVDLTNSMVSTLAGTGSQSQLYPPPAGDIPDVPLNSPWDLELDGDNLYIAMAGSHQLSVIRMMEAHLSPYSGGGREGTRDGSAFVAELAQPSGLALDHEGRLYFADSEASSIRWADANGNVHTLVGSGESLFDFGDIDGVGKDVRLQHPLGVAFADGKLYLADTYNDKIKLVNPETMETTTIAGNERGWRDGDDPLFYEPGGLDVAEGKLYIADTNNHVIRVLDLEKNETSTLVLSGIERFARSSELSEFFGTSIAMDTQVLSSGPGIIVLEIELPEGFKLNDVAPSSISFESEGEISLSEMASVDLTGAEFPLELVVEFAPGSGLLTAELNLYYCEEDQESLCFYEPVQFQIPVQIGSKGEDTIKLNYSLPAPSIVN